MHGKQERIAIAESPDEPPWAEWALAYDRLVWLRIVARGIEPERARELKQEVWEVLFRRHRQGSLPHLSMPGLALTQADFLADSERRLRRSAQRFLRLDHSGPHTDDSSLESSLASYGSEHCRTPLEGESLVLHRARLRRVAELVAGCSQTTQRVFELHYLPPCQSTAEVAVHLGLSEQRVRQVVCELRQMLRRLT